MTQTPHSPPDPTDDAVAAQDIAWRRVHPISPVIRSWSALLVFVYLIMSFSFQQLQGIVEALHLSVVQSLLMLLVVIVVILVVAAGMYAISWRFYQFRITTDAVELHAGVIFRRRRYMRLDRLQAVDIDRPFFARIFGLSKLSLHAADGAETTLTLEYVREAEAEQLRREILYLASGVQGEPDLDPRASEAGTAVGADPAGTSHPGHATIPTYPYADYLEQYVQHNPHGENHDVEHPAAPQHQVAQSSSRELLTTPFGRIIGAACLTGVSTGVLTLLTGGMMTGFFVWLGMRGDNDLPFPVWLLLLLIVFGIGAFTALVTAVTQINTNFNFTARTSDSGVRVTSGMLSTTSNTIPPGRIQAIQVSQPLAYRPFGWYRIQVTVAGYGQADASTMVLPVGTFGDVITMLSVLAPDPGVEYANDLIYQALKFTADDDGFTRVPSRARIWQPVAGRRHGYRTTPTLLLIRFGKLRRNLAMIPHERIQQSALYQGLSDKLSGTLSALFITPPGPVRVTLKNQDPDGLVKLFFDEAHIAAHARRMADKDQWMAQNDPQAPQASARRITRSTTVGETQ